MSIFSPEFVCFFLVVVVSIPSSIFASIFRLISRSIVRPSVTAAMRVDIPPLFTVSESDQRSTSFLNFGSTSKR